MMKGQVRIEFIIGIVIFAAIIFFLSSQITILFSTVVQDANRESLKGKAITALTVLLEDEGDPVNWESQPTGNIIRVGLADEPYKLNNNKLTRLRNECSLLERYELGKYRLIFESYVITRIPMSPIQLCGSENIGAPIVSVARNVYINGIYTKATLELY